MIIILKYYFSYKKKLCVKSVSLLFISMLNLVLIKSLYRDFSLLYMSKLNESIVGVIS